MIFFFFSIKVPNIRADLLLFFQDHTILKNEGDKYPYQLLKNKFHFVPFSKILVLQAMNKYADSLEFQILTQNSESHTVRR